MSSDRPTTLCHLLTIVDGKSEEIVDVIEIKAFELVSFRHQFDGSEESDPDMLDRYSVGPDDAAFLCRALGYQIDFEFSRYAYFIDAAYKDI